MRDISIYFSSPYLGNKLFDLSDTRLNRDNVLLPYATLKSKFEKLGYSCNTFDLLNGKQAEWDIYFDIIKVNNHSSQKALILFESEVIKPRNWNLKEHLKFDLVFTWKDSLVDNVKYFKLNFPQPIPILSPGNNRQTGSICIIAANKKASHLKELYSKRVEIIEWMERFAPTSFDLYGPDWNLYTFEPSIMGKIFNRLKILRRILGKQHATYRGLCKSKHDTLAKYDFSVCFENAVDIDGYITEKIFDCFFSNTIPIYLGPSNINTHIPKNCFIDYSEFSSVEEMFKFVSSLPETKKQEYRTNIKKFLESEKFYPFSTDCFVETITTTLLSRK